jgi:putative oxidoreductase
MLNFFGTLASWGPDFLRLTVGVIMIVHGYPKIADPAFRKGLAQFIQSLGFRPPLFWAYVVGIAEFFGGICLLLGLFTRLAALVLAIEFLVIIVKVKWPKGFMADKGGAEYDWALWMMLLSLLVTGPGRLALDHRLRTGL